MNIVDIINKKRLNQVLNYEELKYFIDGYLKEEIKDYQVSSLLMAICINGMNKDEIFNLTEIMMNSGNKIDLSFISGIKVDKHSTGGIGDKTTLIVGPIVASCGVNFTKMSGRGLGYTGGTIDKLESISGYKISLSKEEFIQQIKDINMAVISQTENIVPADKKIYALRDVTGTVESIPLIASSIMSKKLACGADKILIDVKYGVGALMKTKEDAVELAKLMVDIGKKFNKQTIALITNMNYPLGNFIGNGLEVKEAIDILQYKGNRVLKELCIVLSSYIVSMALNIDLKDAKDKVIDNLISGKSYKKMIEWIKYQGGSIDSINISENIIEVYSEKEGYINNIDALKIGKVSMKLGAGRHFKEDKIDYSVGIELTKNIGDYVKKGELLAKIYFNNNMVSKSEILDAFNIEEIKRNIDGLIYGMIK